MLAELLQPVLVLVVGYALKWGLNKLDVVLDEGAFNAILFGIVSFLLAAVGVEAGVRAGLF